MGNLIGGRGSGPVIFYQGEMNNPDDDAEDTWVREMLLADPERDNPDSYMSIEETVAWIKEIQCVH